MFAHFVRSQVSVPEPSFPSRFDVNQDVFLLIDIGKAQLLAVPGITAIVLVLSLADELMLTIPEDLQHEAERLLQRLPLLVEVPGQDEPLAPPIHILEYLYHLKDIFVFIVFGKEKALK